MDDLPSTVVEPLVLGNRRIFIRDLVLACEIGAFRHERDSRQRVRINVDFTVGSDRQPLKDDLRNVVCYDEIVKGIRAIANGGHINLVETFAERIATMCLADVRILKVQVRIEKLDIYADAVSAGVEIERINPSS